MRKVINLDNDQLVKNLKKRKILRYVIIFLALLTVFLAAYSLFTDFSFYYSLIPFVMYTFFKYWRDSLKIEKK